LRPVSDERDVDPLMWQRWRMGHLYAATGAPVSNHRRVWNSTAEAARRAAPEERKKVARTGAPAALGIFLQTNDTTALTELRALSGDDFSHEVRAWLALERADADKARDILNAAKTDSVQTVWDQGPNSYYRKPMAAELYYSLGDYYQTLALLEEFEPDRFATDWFDIRWGMVGRVRMLRAMAYEQLGQIEEAQQQYRDVIAQWQSSDESMERLLREAESELARLSGRAG
jgi:tetratricopeptide (TPR) repeat protein